MARKNSARLQPAESPEANRRLQATLAAFLPAARLTVALHQPMDTARALMTSAALKATADRCLKGRATALGRTTRSVRMLIDRFRQEVVYDEIDQTENVVRRAEALLAESPLTRAQLAARLPQYYAFDSASVALRALIREGRARPLVSKRAQLERFELVPLTERKHKSGGQAELDAVEAHMGAVAAHLRVAVGGAQEVSAGVFLATDRFSARPEAFKAALDDIERFIEVGTRKLAANADLDAPRHTLHFGGSAHR